jgi:serine/threonine protein kinase, bacterial
VPSRVLQTTRRVDGALEEFLASIGDVFVVHRGHDSGNTSYGVRIGPDAWFVKYAEHDEAIGHLESAVRFHAAVRHPAIIPLVGWFRTTAGMAIVHEFRDGEVLNDPLAPGGRPREHPDSAFARFRRLPVAEIVTALEVLLEAHVAAANAGFVAVDFYDGSIVYDFERRRVQLCDLDSYRRGPYTLERDRQYGSTRFMAPEEFERGARIDERTMVFTLGRAAFVFLSAGQRGEREAHVWRANRALLDVAWTATEVEREKRFGSVADLLVAWRVASGANGDRVCRRAPPT